MSEMLTVPTAFENIPDLSAGLIDRVDPDQIILYGPTPYEPGTAIDFSVLLLDGTPGFEGRGVVMESIDGGDERDPSIRFDTVVVNLELGEEAAAIFEGMVLERQLLAGDDTEEVAYEAEESEEEVAYEAEESEEESAELAEESEEEAEEAIAEEAIEASEPEAEELAAEVAGDEAAASTEWDSDSETVAGELDESIDLSAPSVDEAAEDELGEVAFDGADEAYEGDQAEVGLDDGAEDELDDEAAFAEQKEAQPSISLPDEIPAPDENFRGAAPPEAPTNPGGFAITNELTEGLMRPVEQDVWTPEAGERPEPRPSSGLFQYAEGLPVPAAPPRPAMDESLRVTRAPHPSDEGEIEAAAPVELAEEAFEGEAFEGEAEALEADEIEADEVETLEVEGHGEENSAAEIIEEDAIEAAEYEGSESAAEYDEAVEYGEVESRD